MGHVGTPTDDVGIRIQPAEGAFYGALVTLGVGAVVVRTPFEDHTVRIRRGGPRPDGEPLELAPWAATQFRFGIELVLGVRIRAAESMVGLHQDASQHVGFFVTLSGKTMVFERAAGSQDFVPPRQPLRVFPAVLAFDPHFGFVDGDPGMPLPDNVIERITPRFFW